MINIVVGPTTLHILPYFVDDLIEDMGYRFARNAMTNEIDEDDPQVVAYHSCELLSADPIRDAETGEECVGITVTDSETTINLCVSKDDALLLLRQVAEVLYTFSAEEGDHA